MYTSAQAIVPRTPVQKCTQRSLQKKCTSIYIHINTYAYAYICTQTRMHINDTAPHANASLLRLTINAQICIHIQIHMYINAYVYMFIYTCIYMHIYMFVHIHTCTSIHTHIQHVYMHTRKHTWKDGVAATAREAWLEARKLRPSPCPLQSKRELPSVTSSPNACSRGTTDKRRTTTTDCSSSHHHDSALSRLQPLICAGAKLIHPVHTPPKLRATEVTPWNEVMFLPFPQVFSHNVIDSVCETWARARERVRPAKESQRAQGQEREWQNAWELASESKRDREREPGRETEWKSESEHKRASIHGSGGLVIFRALASDVVRQHRVFWQVALIMLCSFRTALGRSALSLASRICTN